MTDGPTRKPQGALLSFKAENARSYRDEVELSLLAGRLTPKSVVRILPTAGQPVRVLPAAGIFGANASGKSALLKAMADMRALVIDSFRLGAQTVEEKYFAAFRRVPFALTPIPNPKMPEHVIEEVLDSDERPTRYEVDLTIEDVRWLYGVEVGNGGVVSEYAYHFPHGRQALVFRRECEPAKKHDVLWGPAFRAEGQNLDQFAHAYALLLSVAGAAEWKPLVPLFFWFQKNLYLAEAANRHQGTARTLELLESPHHREQIVSLLRVADLGIVDAAKESIAFEFKEHTRDVQQGVRDALRDPGRVTFKGDDADLLLEDSIRFVHRGPWGSSTDLSVFEESLGTLAWAGLIGLVLDALERGTVLLIDELDASLHPHLVRDLVALFQSPRRNPNAAQLIFNAHDVTLLGDSSERTLSRDQVWITEKQPDGATTLYPLSDFRPRHDEAISRRYMQGRYGGVPTINPAEYARATEPIDP